MKENRNDESKNEKTSGAETANIPRQVKVAMRILAGSPLPTDPAIIAESEANLNSYLMEFVGLTEADFDKVERLVAIKKRMKDGKVAKA